MPQIFWQNKNQFTILKCIVLDCTEMFQTITKVSVGVKVFHQTFLGSISMKLIEIHWFL